MKNKLLPIHDLIQAKPKPILTPSLVPALRDNFREMVETYIYTDTIRGYFENIFDHVARGAGQGFWVQAEYGAGKTHFLVTLAALLAHAGDEKLWKSVQDASLHQTQKHVSSAKLFPVVLSLKGEGAADKILDRSLLDVLMEGFQDAIEEKGLSDKVQLTAAQDIIRWFESETSAAIRTEAAQFVKKETGKTFDAYRDEYGINELSKVLSKYLHGAGINLRNVAVGTKDRLAYIYKQLTAPGMGYNGLLVVIDEYEGWEKGHSSPEEKVRDADLLETLGFILPRDSGLGIFTILASQSDVPAKLQGSSGGDRFIRLPLLAQTNARDYDIIISRRSRDLITEKSPEIRDYFKYYSSQFQFAKKLSETEFRDVFPFQPRCFEAIRRITARELPNARSGLSVFWEVVNDTELTGRSDLIRLTDMVRSPHLIEQCLTKSIYKEAYQAYKTGFESISELGLDEEEIPQAQDIFTTLFLWHVTYLEAPKHLSVEEIAEATLTIQSRDGINANDVVMLILEQMKQLPQVVFEDNSAAFKIAEDAGGLPLRKFNEYKREALKNVLDLQTALTESLFFTTRDTGGSQGIFAEFQMDNSLSKRLSSRNLEYVGEVIVANTWRMNHGVELPKEDTHFRIVILPPTASASISPEDIKDERIAAVTPGELSDEVREAAAAYKSWKRMHEEYQNQTGKEAEEFRSWLGTQKQAVYSKLVATNLKIYQSGEITTKESLGISARDAFGQGGSNNDNRLGYIVNLLLTNAYRSFPIETSSFRSNLTSVDYGKIFEGYFSKDAKTADTGAAKNFGVHLGLSNSDKPQHFAPQVDIQVFRIMDEMLAAKGDLRIYEIYDRLSRPPYGLPYGLIQLFLLAYVRHHHPRYDLSLKTGHKLQTRSAQPITRDRLTSSTVAELAWKLRVEDKFDMLLPGREPSWQDTLSYAKLLNDGLHNATDQNEIDRQSDTLLKTLSDLKNEIPALQGNLQTLASNLGEQLSVSTTQTLKKLVDLTDGEYDGYVNFYESVVSIFESPDTLRKSIEILARLRTLRDLTAEIVTARNYLQQAQPLATALLAFRNNTVSQIRLDTLIAGPEIWTRLKPDVAKFKDDYRNDYQKHHRDYYAQTANLRNDLAQAPAQLQILASLNEISNLGKPFGEHLPQRYTSFIAALKTCSVKDVTAVSVEAAPVCDKCQLQMNTLPPGADITRFLNELTENVTAKARQLTSAFAGVQVSEKNSPATPLVKAAQAEDLAKLAAALNPKAAEAVNQLLKEMGILTIELDLQSELKKAFPAVDEKQLPAFLSEVEKLLKTAFAQAHKDNSGKKSFRITLK